MDGLQKHKRGGVDLRRRSQSVSCKVNDKVCSIMRVNSTAQTPKLTVDVDGWPRLMAYLSDRFPLLHIDTSKSFPVHKLTTIEKNASGTFIEAVEDDDQG